MLAATRLFNDLNKTWFQLLDGWNVVGEDTHFTRLGGNVDLDASFMLDHDAGMFGLIGRHIHILGLVYGLRLTCQLSLSLQ